MKLNKDEFRALQITWYEKLSQSGFKDIEKFKGDELVLAQSASHCFGNLDALSSFLKASYFRLLAQLIYDETTVFRNEVDRHILIRYSEGMKIKYIVQELKMLKMPRDRNSVRFIVRRYEMIWGIRNYTAKQLHKKSI